MPPPCQYMAENSPPRLAVRYRQLIPPGTRGTVPAPTCPSPPGSTRLRCRCILSTSKIHAAASLSSPQHREVSGHGAGCALGRLRAARACGQEEGTGTSPACHRRVFSGTVTESRAASPPAVVAAAGITAARREHGGCCWHEWGVGFASQSLGIQAQDSSSCGRSGKGGETLVPPVFRGF